MVEISYVSDGLVCMSQEQGEGEGIFYATDNLLGGASRTFETDSIFFRGGVHYRVMIPFDSKLAAAICRGLQHGFVKLGSKVLYLAKDDSSAVAISHLSDMVGINGTVYVVALSGGYGFQRVSARFNVVCIGDINHPVTCCSAIIANTNHINVIYCDMGIVDVDQVKYLSYYASQLMTDGGNFVTFFQAKKKVNEVPIPPECVYLSEMTKLKESGFHKTQSLTLGRFFDEYCVAGDFLPA